MRIAIAALVISAIGCASKPAQEPQPARKVSGTPNSAQVLTLQPSEMQGVAVRADTAETKCFPLREDEYDNRRTFYRCTTMAFVALTVNSKAAGVENKFYQGMDEYTMMGVPSYENLAMPNNDAARAELAALHADGLNGMERRYRHLAEGCNGEQIVMTYSNDNLRMEAGEFLSDMRCKARKKIAKTKATVVFVYDSTQAHAANAKVLANAAAQNTVAFMQSSHEQLNELIRRVRIQVSDKVYKAGRAASEALYPDKN